ncbi:hypothetical protein F511_44721 [Dorcoceras hygrometricum]|uniref:Uncharacterized protein n=1 Tax=Dorcoceras hygrometricum TaxID=472368 RepID=A0A2Z7ANI9_9LAMI|nr:hypothetical protein F511_44721 [Dorcoceras hygrometricum]
MAKATRSLQNKRTQVLFTCRYFTEERCTKIERRQDKPSEALNSFGSFPTGRNSTEAIYSRQRPLKKSGRCESVLLIENETLSVLLSVRSVGATTYCGRITLNIQCTNKGKNEEIDEAINRH